MTAKLRDCFHKLEAIVKDASICPSQQVIYPLKSIKAKNNDLIVGISTVKNDLEPNGKANDFKKAVSYMKNCVPEKSSNSLHISFVYSGDRRKVQADIKAFKHTIDKKLIKGGGGGKMD